VAIITDDPAGVNGLAELAKVADRLPSARVRMPPRINPCRAAMASSRPAGAL
jgi:hypothetical protein